MVLLEVLEVAKLEMQMSSHVTPPHIRMRRARHTAPESAICTTARRRDRASSAAAHMLGCLHPPVQAASTHDCDRHVACSRLRLGKALPHRLTCGTRRVARARRRRFRRRRLSSARASTGPVARGSPGWLRRLLALTTRPAVNCWCCERRRHVQRRSSSVLLARSGNSFVAVPRPSPSRAAAPKRCAPHADAPHV